MNTKDLIIITGPTSVGKTNLSIEIAKNIKGEIVSADSMQVYKGMDIGTAKITPKEMQGIPHHLIDVIEPKQNYNAAIFSEMAEKCIGDIYNRNSVPILVGGTGFYIQAVLYGVDFTDGDEDPKYRELLENRIKNGEAGLLYKELSLIDPEASAKISCNDHKRIIRALEFYKTSGKKISEHNETEKGRTSPYNFIYFVINDNRDNLYKNIDLRVDEMFKNGLENEVKELYESGRLCGTAAHAIGYKQLISYFKKEIDLEEAIRLIKRDTRHYAKRQITWFKRESSVIWINKNEFDYDNKKILEYMLMKIREKGIL